MTKPVILITGAGGFIGGWIAEALHLAKYGTVRAGISRWSSAARIARFPFEIVECDIMSRESLDKALAGVDVVIHCARARATEDVTVDGTRLLLERSRAAGVTRFIHMSSVAVYGETPHGGVTEDSGPYPPITTYGQGKIDSEKTCEEFSSPDFPVAVMRPTLVYGPFSDQWSIPFIQRFASGKWTALGERGLGKCNLVYVGDLVRFAQHLIETNTGAYAVFNANGPEIPTWNEYLEKFNLALGFPPLKKADPALGLKVAMRRPVRNLGKYLLANHRDLLVAASNRSPQLREAMKKTEEDLRIRPNDDEMARFSLDCTYSMEKAAAIGFVPKTGVDEGIAMTADWARHIAMVA